MKDVQGKTAFITGGASGIGLGIAKILAKAGVNVVIADIREDHLDQAKRELNGARVHAVLLDVADRKAFGAAVDEAEPYGRWRDERLR